MLVFKNIIMKIYFLVAGLILSFIIYIISFFVSQNKFRSIVLVCTKITRAIGYKILGIQEEYRGIENIPEGPCIFASKHQSSLETIYYFNMFKLHTVYCYKKELMATPMWGRILKKLGGVSIDRKRGNQILNHMQTQINDYLMAGVSIVIFPEGTRVPSGKTKPFKKGIQLLYLNNKVPIIPVALNTGLVIPKKGIGKASKIIIEFLPAILPSSVTYDKFLPNLEKEINAKTKELEAEVLKK